MRTLVQLFLIEDAQIGRILADTERQWGTAMKILSTLSSLYTWIGMRVVQTRSYTTVFHDVC